MAFNSIPTITTGDVATAAWGNTYLKNNFALTAPAVLTAQGDIVIASGANTPIRLAKDTNPTRSLTNTGGSNAPAWALVNLANGVSGILSQENGGLEFDLSAITTNDGLGGASAGVAEIKTPVTQAEAEAGTGTRFSLWSPARVKEAIDALAAGNLARIGTIAASGTVALNIGGLDSTYDAYLLIGSDLVGSVDIQHFEIRFGDSGGIDSGASDYGYHCSVSSPGNPGYSGQANASVGHIRLGAASQFGNAAGEGLGFALWLLRPGDGSVKPIMSGTYTGINGSGAAVGGQVIGVRNAVITLTQVEIQFASGNIDTGRFTVYGVKHA